MGGREHVEQHVYVFLGDLSTCVMLMHCLTSLPLTEVVTPSFMRACFPPPPPSPSPLHAQVPSSCLLA